MPQAMSTMNRTRVCRGRFWWADRASSGWIRPASQGRINGEPGARKPRLSLESLKGRRWRGFPKLGSLGKPSRGPRSQDSPNLGLHRSPLLEKSLHRLKFPASIKSQTQSPPSPNQFNWSSPSGQPRSQGLCPFLTPDLFHPRHSQRGSPQSGRQAGRRAGPRAS